MALSLDAVARLALSLPDVVEGTSYGNRAWRAGSKLFVWERPLRPADRAALGDRAPDGPIVALAVDDLADTEAVLQAGNDGLFTTPHFDGHAVVLAALDAVDPVVLEELVVDAWCCRAPTPAVRAFLDAQGRGGRAEGGSSAPTR